MEPWTVRFFVRAGVATLLALLSALGVAVVDDAVTTAEWVTVAVAGVGAFAGYLGIGAAVPQVEPFVGKADSGAVVPVPVPPAKPELGG